MTVLALNGLDSNLLLTFPLAGLVILILLVWADLDHKRRRDLDQAELNQWRRDQRAVPPHVDDDSYTVDFLDGVELYEDLRERAAS